jgi:hypothetical protein
VRAGYAIPNWLDCSFFCPSRVIIRIQSQADDPAILGVLSRASGRSFEHAAADRK